MGAKILAVRIKYQGIECKKEKRIKEERKGGVFIFRQVKVTTYEKLNLLHFTFGQIRQYNLGVHQP